MAAVGSLNVGLFFLSVPGSTTTGLVLCLCWPEALSALHVNAVERKERCDCRKVRDG